MVGLREKSLKRFWGEEKFSRFAEKRVLSYSGMFQQPRERSVGMCFARNDFCTTRTLLTRPGGDCEFC